VAGVTPVRPWRTHGRSAWQRFAQPLFIAGWTVSAGTIFLALVRNLALLGGGRRGQRSIWRC
jgi:hypothetical protein